MRIFSIFLIFLILFSLVSAEQFNPNTVKAMDVNLKIEAIGNFYGTVHPQDKMEVKALTLRDTETQKVLSVEEKLYIGNDVFEPDDYHFSGNNKFAVFKIDNLMKYSSTPIFRVEINARVQANAIFELTGDSDLSLPVKGYEEYLQETKYIEVNDQALRSKAELEFSTSNSALETIRQIAEWVNSNIIYDFENYYNGTWSAKHTYESKRGVCDEFANLTAAFARIKGIPTKYIAGVSFDGKQFGNHGWNEVLIGKKWIGVDSTYGEAGYLDAAHIVFAEGNDASELSNLQVTIQSIDELSLQTELKDPVVEINNIEFFEDLTDIQLDYPKQLGLAQEFTVTAKVKNKSNSLTILPLKLLMHKAFLQREQSHIILLAPNEEKTVEFFAVSPAEGLKGYFYDYDMLFLVPDKNISAKLRLYPVDSNAQSDKPSIELKDISPYVEDGSLRLQFTFFNNGLSDGKIKIAATHKGETKEFNETIPAFTEKKLSYELKGISPGPLQLEISGDFEKSIEFSIPEKIEQKKVIKITPKIKPKQKPEEVPIDNSGKDFVSTAIDDFSQFYSQNKFWADIIVGLLAAISVLLVFKSFLIKNN